MDSNNLSVKGIVDQFGQKNINLEYNGELYNIIIEDEEIIGLYQGNEELKNKKIINEILITLYSEINKNLNKNKDNILGMLLNCLLSEVFGDNNASLLEYLDKKQEEYGNKINQMDKKYKNMELEYENNLLKFNLKKNEIKSVSRKISDLENKINDINTRFENINLNYFSVIFDLNKVANIIFDLNNKRVDYEGKLKEYKKKFDYCSNQIINLENEEIKQDKKAKIINKYGSIDNLYDIKKFFEKEINVFGKKIFEVDNDLLKFQEKNEKLKYKFVSLSPKLLDMKVDVFGEYNKLQDLLYDKEILLNEIEINSLLQEELNLFLKNLKKEISNLGEEKRRFKKLNKKEKIEEIENKLKERKKILKEQQNKYKNSQLESKIKDLDKKIFYFNTEISRKNNFFDSQLEKIVGNGYDTKISIIRKKLLELLDFIDLDMIENLNFSKKNKQFLKEIKLGNKDKTDIWEIPNSQLFNIFVNGINIINNQDEKNIYEDIYLQKSKEYQLEEEIKDLEKKLEDGETKKNNYKDYFDNKICEYKNDINLLERIISNKIKDLQSKFLNNSQIIEEVGKFVDKLREIKEEHKNMKNKFIADKREHAKIYQDDSYFDEKIELNKEKLEYEKSEYTRQKIEEIINNLKKTKEIYKNNGYKKLDSKKLEYISDLKKEEKKLFNELKKHKKLKEYFIEINLEFPKKFDSNTHFIGFCSKLLSNLDNYILSLKEEQSVIEKEKEKIEFVYEKIQQIKSVLEGNKV